MKLKSFGCSFIFGSELSDCQYENKVDPVLTGRLTSYSQLTWPALMAQQLGYTYECYASQGSGNLQILEQLLTQSVQPDPALMVIGWSWIDRFDYYTETVKSNPWASILPRHDSDLAKMYYQHLHSEFRDKLTSLIHIKLAIDILQQKGIPFVMTVIDQLLFDTRWHCTPAVVELQNYIRPHITFFEDKTFVQWGKDNGYAVSKKFHPLDDAHQAAAELIIKSFDKKNTSDPAQLALF